MKSSKKILISLFLVLALSLVTIVFVASPQTLNGKSVVNWFKQALGEGPTITVSGVPDNKIIRGPIPITITATSEKGVASITVNNEELEVTDGTANYSITTNGSYVIVATDLEGVTSTETVQINQIDDVAPSATKPDVETTTNSIKVTFKQADNLGTANSGLTDDRSFRLTNAAGTTGEWVTVTENEYTFTSLQDGTIYYVQTKAEDLVGNASMSEVTEVMTEFPEWNQIVEVTRTPEDTVTWTTEVVYNIRVIGGDRYRFKVSTDGTSFTETPMISIKKNETTLYGQIICNGVESEIYEIDTVENVDVYPPDAAAPSTQTTANKITATCNQSDDKSGIDESTIRYRLLETDQTVITDWQESNEFTNLISQKDYYVQTKVKDILGNEAESTLALAATRAVTHGNSAVINYNTNWTNQDVEVTITNPSTEFELEISTNGTVWNETSPLTFTENGTIYTRFTDGTNYGEVGIRQVTNIDKVAPTDTEPTVIATESSLTVTNMQTDALSGIETTQYRLCTTSEGTESLPGYDWSNIDTYNGLIPNTTYYVQTKVTDRAGNTTLSKIKTIKTTNIPSTEGKVSVEATNIGETIDDWTTKVHVAFEITDSTALVKYTLEVSTDDENYMAAEEMDLTENKPLYTRFRDSRGYTGNGFVSYEVTNIDTMPPTTTAPTGEMTEEQITVTFNQVDNEVGLDETKTRYRLLADAEGMTVAKDWQESNVFTGLTANTTYYMQTSATDRLHNTSESNLTEIKTWVVPSIDNLTLSQSPVGDWTGGNVTVTANYSKRNFQVQMRIDNGEYVTTDSVEVENNNSTVYARFINGDLPGTEEVSLKVENIDKVAPSTTKPVITETTTRKIVAEGKQEDSQSGVKKVMYRLAADETGADALEGHDWQDSNEFDELIHNTTYYVQTKTEDNVGNESVSETAEVTTQAVPNTNEENISYVIEPDTWTNGDVTITVTPLIEDYEIEISIGGGDFQKTNRVTISENAFVRIRYSDGINAGGFSGPVITNIDKIPPTATKPKAIATKTEIEVTLAQSDPSEEDDVGELFISGIDPDTIRYRLVKDETGAEALEGYDWQVENLFENLYSDEIYYVQTKVSDRAGNETISEVTEVVTEEIPNANTYVTYEKTPKEWTNQDVIITFDNSQPDFDLEFSTDRTNYELLEDNELVIPENMTIYVRLTNHISSGKEMTIIVNNIDKVKPNVSASISKVTSDTISVNAIGTDSQSGIDKIQYRLVKNRQATEALPGRDWQDSNQFTDLIEETTYFVEVKAIDKAGNEEATVVETKTLTTRTIITSDDYRVLEDERIITRVPLGTSLEEFREKIVCNQDYEIIDTKGMTVTGGDMKTGYILQTDTAEYEIAVIADISGDGLLNIIDLSRMRAHIVNLNDFELQGVYLMAADISGNGVVDILDLSRMRKMLVE